MYGSEATGAVFQKKTIHASEQDRPDVAEKRRRWRRRQGSTDARRLIFIDETWAKTNMTRTYGRSELGTRLIERVPAGRWETTTFLGALRANGFVAPLTVDGPINGPLFLAWVAANRLSMGGVLHAPEERLTPEQALAAVTLEAAFPLGLEDEIGSIRAGKRADFTVVDRDPLAVPVAEWNQLEVLATVFEGRAYPVRPSVPR